MRYTLFALAGAILALLGLFLYVMRRRRQALRDEPEKPHKLTPPAQLYQLQKCEKFWGVSVESHCGASSGLAGIQFPFESVPRLPVSECAEASCKCSFIGLPERRQRTERRRGMDRRGSIRMESSDRRNERPRRKEDLVSWQAYRHL